MSFVIPEGLPTPVKDALRRVSDALRGLVSVPDRVVETVADLPAADAWKGRGVVVKNVAGTPVLAKSTGTAWFRTDTGAVL